jgi:hypothetical protein
MLLGRWKEERHQIHSLDDLYFEYTKRKFSIDEEKSNRQEWEWWYVHYCRESVSKFVKESTNKKWTETIYQLGGRNVNSRNLREKKIKKFIDYFRFEFYVLKRWYWIVCLGLQIHTIGVRSCTLAVGFRSVQNKFNIKTTKERIIDSPPNVTPTVNQ